MSDFLKCENHDCRTPCDSGVSISYCSFHSKISRGNRSTLKEKFLGKLNKSKIEESVKDHKMDTQTTPLPSIRTLAAVALLFMYAFRASSFVRFITRTAALLTSIVVTSAFGILILPFLYLQGRLVDANYYIGKFISLVFPWTMAVTVHVEGNEWLEKARPVSLSATIRARLMC
jgi:hypothetical protein